MHNRTIEIYFWADLQVRICHIIYENDSLKLVFWLHTNLQQLSFVQFFLRSEKNSYFN